MPTLRGQKQIYKDLKENPGGAIVVGFIFFIILVVVTLLLGY